MSLLIKGMKVAQKLARVPLTLFLLFSLQNHLSSAHGFRDSWPFYWPCSIAESKKHGDFLYSPNVTPSRFMWEGHDIEVYECWRENAKTNHWLYFKLKVDDKASGERAIFKKQKKRIYFSDETEKNTVIDLYGAVHRTVVHSVRILNESTYQVKLRVGTDNEGNPPPKMSDVVLNFDLSPPSRKN